MTINIREARVGDYLVTPAGKRRIGGVGSWGLELEDEYSISFLSAGYFGFTVEREEPEWHECSGVEAGIAALKGDYVEEFLPRTAEWRPLTAVWTIPALRTCMGRFRTRSAPSSEVLAEWEGMTNEHNEVRYPMGEGACFVPVPGSSNLLAGERVKVQVIKA